MLNVKTLGITGGIGSGKSFISTILTERFGIPVYDCDREAKRLTASNEEIRSKLTQMVSYEVYDEKGLNKKYLADFLFANKENAQKVNAIIHPVVWEDFQSWVAKQTSTLVAMESAILFESGFSEGLDFVLFVDASEEVRLQRAMLRDAATEEQIRARMRMQHPELYREKADFIVNTSKGDDQRLVLELRDIIERIEK